MPTYEYECETGHEFTLQQSIKEEPADKCPICMRRCKRLISRTSFHLRGPGWAKDGYSSSGGKKKDKR